MWSGPSHRTCPAADRPCRYRSRRNSQPRHRKGLDMDLSKLRTGARIAAVAAILLLLDLFLNWYSVDIGQAFGGFAAAAGVNTSLSAWEVFDFTDILLFAVVLATLTLLALEAFGSGVRLPVPGSTIIAVLGGIATVWVLWRMINEPGPD